MTPGIASCVFVLVIIGLFLLDREPESRVSKALCLPLVWLWLTSSRSATEWMAVLGFGPPPATKQANMYMEGSPLDRNVLIGLMILALVVLVVRGRFGTLIRANLPIVLFLVYGAMSTVWSDFPDVTIRRWFKAVGCLLMVMVVLRERDRDAATRRLFVWSGFLLIPLSILLIKYYPAIGRSYNHWTWIVSVTGVTTHKNTLGGICQLYGVVFVWHFLAAYRNRQLPDRTRHLIAHGTGLAMVVWLFLQANSVTAQSCFLLATAFLIASTTRAVAQRQWLVHLLMAVLVIVPFTILFLGIGGSAIEGMGRDSTLTGRTDIWPRVIALVDNPLVGTGFESFWLGERLQTMQNYQLGLNETHNGYLEIWVSLGWIGTLFLAFMILRGYRNIIILYRQDPDIGRLRLALFLTVIVSSFTEAAFRTDSVSWIAFLLTTMSHPEGWLRETIQNPQMTAETPGQTQFETVAVGSSHRQPTPELSSLSKSNPRLQRPASRRL
jgi:exopolysaccharide production protein ExoQ